MVASPPLEALKKPHGCGIWGTWFNGGLGTMRLMDFMILQVFSNLNYSMRANS